MDLIERYLTAVGLLLPSRQRTDITAELREALLSRRDEKEVEVGRPLTRGEDADILRAFGHPLVVAGRYGRQQYLVGPELYPLYVFAVKALLAIIAASAVITGIVHAAVGPDQPGAAIVAMLGVLWTGSISSVGALTIIAAIMQRQRIPLRFLSDWDPADLPKLPRRPLIRRQTRFDHVGAIVWLSVFALWWAHGLPAWIPYVTTIPLKAGERLDLTRAPIWDTLFWPVLAVALAGIAVHAWKLVRDRRGGIGHGLDIVTQIAVAVLAWIALRAGHWVDVSGVGVSADALPKIDRGVNIGVQVALIVTVIAATASAAYEVYRLVRKAPLGA